MHPQQAVPKKKIKTTTHNTVYTKSVINFYKSGNLLIFLIFTVIFFLSACNQPYSHKKKGYFKIDVPTHNYQPFHDNSLPYTFEYSTAANTIKDSTYFDNNPEDVYWRNIDYPQFNAKIFLSYKKIGGQALFKSKQGDGSYKDSLGINTYDKLIADAFNLTNKNDDVAHSKKDSFFTNPNGISGIMFKLGGDVATQRQFFLTDTTKHFLRGALYFYATPNADSIAPVLDFIQKDLDHLINTFRWQ